MTSLTYRLVLLILKLKGVKKDFSEHPIDFKKIRQKDVHQPKHKQFSKSLISQFEILESTITEIKSKQKTNNKLLLFIHGGAFISGPAKHHWDTVQEIKKHIDTTIWMCDYPKAPESKFSIFGLERVASITGEIRINLLGIVISFRMSLCVSAVAKVPPTESPISVI